MKSSIRDGWGLLLNASSHITNPDAIKLLESTRLANFESWSRQWVNHSSLTAE